MNMILRPLNNLKNAKSLRFLPFSSPLWWFFLLKEETELLQEVLLSSQQWPNVLLQFLGALLRVALPLAEHLQNLL